MAPHTTKRPDARVKGRTAAVASYTKEPGGTVRKRGTSKPGGTTGESHTLEPRTAAEQTTPRSPALPLKKRYHQDKRHKQAKGIKPNSIKPNGINKPSGRIRTRKTSRTSNRSKRAR